VLYVDFNYIFTFNNNFHCINFHVIWLSLCNLSPPRHRVLPFYLQPNFLPSPSLSRVGLPCYTEELALAFADESSDSSSPCSSPLRHYNSKVLSYLDLSASESEDSWIVMHWYSFFHYYWFSLKFFLQILDFLYNLVLFPPHTVFGVISIIIHLNFQCLYFQLYFVWRILWSIKKYHMFSRN
jgi:hypothetical protein